MKVKLIIITLIIIAIAIYSYRQRKNNNPLIYYTDKFPLKGYEAITLAPFCIVVKSPHKESALKHEMVHWEQFQKQGLLPYYYGYTKGYLKFGYRKNPYEVEARLRAGEEPLTVGGNLLT